MTEKYTPGPWKASEHQVLRDSETFYRIAGGCTLEDARLIAAAPMQFELVERVYVLLADVRNQWQGRHTAAGQRLLSDLRDSICSVTGREAQDVQDDYGNRAAIARATGKNWTQPICQDCWITRNPDREPVRVSLGDPENCCDCGEATNAGIYIRVDPRTVWYSRRERDHAQD